MGPYTVPPNAFDPSSTDRPNGFEPHNGLLYCYKGTYITGETAFNRYKTRLNDALIDACPSSVRELFPKRPTQTQPWQL
jgi:hypothetical protein